MKKAFLTVMEEKVYKDRNFQIVCASGLVAMMGVSMIVPAFPAIMDTLRVSEQSIGLIITLSTMPSLLLTPIAGIMADRYGRKRILVPSLFFLGVFGGCCAFAPNFTILLVLRVLQGISCALMFGALGAIIGDLFTGQKRAQAMGYNTTAMYGGYILYPVIGGALAGLGWNYAFLPFFIGVPLAFVAWAFLRCPEPESQQSLRSYLGEALHYLKGLKVLWLFSSSVLTYVLLYGAYLTYFSVLLEGRFQASPVIIGLFISTLGLFTAVASSQVGRLSRRFSMVSLITFGFIVYAFAMASVMFLPYIWLCLLPTIIFGIAHGLNLPGQQVIAAGVAPFEHRAGFMAISGTMNFLGMTIGPVIMGLIFGLTSLNTTFLIAAVIALIIPGMAVLIGKSRLSAT